MTTLTRRRLLQSGAIGFGALVASSGLAACGSSGGGSTGASGAGTLNLWESDPVKAVLTPALPWYRETHRGMDVKLTEFGFEDLFAKLSVVTQAQDGVPDVVYMEGLRYPKFVYQRRLADMTAAIEPYLSRYPEYEQTLITQADGKRYGFPADIGPAPLWYKQDVFAREGVEPPTTWDDYLALGRRLKTRGIALHSLKAGGNGDTATFLQLLAIQNGATFFEPDGTPVVYSPEFVEVLGRVRELVDGGMTLDVEDFSQQWAKAWKAGKLATYMNGFWMLVVFPSLIGVKPGQDWGIGIAPLPTFAPGGARFSNNGESLWCVPAASPRVEQAIELCRWLSTDARFGVHWRETGQIPAYTPNRDTRRALDHEWPEFGGRRIWTLVAEAAAERPTHFSFVPATTEFNDAVAAEWPAFYKGELSPDAFARKLQQRAEEIAVNYPVTS
jgi:ABC-type glycerol-3-phosphate transport system substrate-binding protein